MPVRFILLALLLAGCATPGLRQIDSPAQLRPAVAGFGDFQLEGRLSVRSPGQTFTGNLSWRRADTGDTLLLSGPLGQGAAEIQRRDGQVELKTADGERVVEDSDERLLSRVLGLSLPLDGLVDWLTGRPRPGVPFLAGQDGEGRLAWLEQEGWHIEYDRYARYGVRWLPGRIVARRGEDLDFRFVADRWELP